MPQLFGYISFTLFCSNDIVCGGKRGQSKVCDTRSSAVLDGVLNEKKQSYGKVSKAPREITKSVGYT